LLGETVLVSGHRLELKPVGDIEIAQLAHAVIDAADLDPALPRHQRHRPSVALAFTQLGSVEAGDSRAVYEVVHGLEAREVRRRQVGFCGRALSSDSRGGGISGGRLGA